MKKTEEGVIPSTNLFWVVGIGASAGGLDAFKQLIKTIPVNSGMAYILVQHLDPNHESILVELLQKSTTIPIHEITDNVHVEPDQIYVIPPNKFLTASDGILRLTDRSSGSQKGMSIDLFFNSLAEVHESQAIGVVLSGTGKDGTLGLKAINDYGGITVAQQQQTAAYDEMPQSAINADVVDFVLSPEEIIPHLLALNTLWKNKTPEERTPTPRLEDLTIKKILGLVEMQKGVDFTYYKQTTIQRRISRRMLLKNITKTDKYYKLLKDNPNEVDILYQDILIPVTDFFRDQSAFDQLCGAVLPELTKGKSETEPLRAWVVGCSTGQEAFSIAICLHEFLEHHVKTPRIQIFATDISDAGINKARSGIYSPNDVANISALRLKKYFNKVQGGYQVNKLIRDQCVFARHNILVDPPFANMDLITCRNVLIYMDTYLQRKAMEVFHYALHQKGILMLGKSESVGISSDLFGSFSDTEKIYLRNSVPGRFIHVASKRKEEALSAESNSVTKDYRNNDDFQRNSDAVILSKSAAGVIVNDQLDIVQFRGNTGDWLEPAPGKPSLNILKMAKHGLVLELRSALLKARKRQDTIIADGILLQINGWKKIVTIEVSPLANTINPYFLIQFKNTEEVLEKKRSTKTKNNPHELRIIQLEKELKQTREDMRTFAEEQEAGHEELLSANEELASGSEELRSLNEELETSKEELQSTVEELSASNQELAVRNEQINYSKQYAEAIVTTIREPLIILDKNLRVKSANNSFYKTFGRKEKETVDKLFYELEDNQWDLPELHKLLERALLEKSFYESYEVKQIFSSIGERSMLLNARKIFNDNTSETLILLAIEDITERRILENRLKKNSDYLKTILEATPQITLTAAVDGNTTYANKYFLDYSGLSLSETITSGWLAIVNPKIQEETSRSWKHAMNTGEDFYKELLLKRHDDVYRWHIFRAIAIRNDDTVITSWVSTAADIHDQKMFSEELEKQVKSRTQLLKEANFDLVQSNENLEQFAFIASHDLQEPLRKIKTFSNVLLNKFTTELSDEGKSLVGKIYNSSERMSVLIQDVLSFSRIETSKNAFVSTNLTSILDNVVQDLNLLIADKNALVSYGELPNINAIPFQMNQLFVNLLNNSLKFAREGVQPVITITSSILTPAQTINYPSLNQDLSYYEILFTDNGIGFEEKYAERIFQIFQRLHTQQQFRGTGIGLALCKKIALHHNGEIFATSNEHSSTVIHIIFPLKHFMTAMA